MYKITCAFPRWTRAVKYCIGGVKWHLFLDATVIGETCMLIYATRTQYVHKFIYGDTVPEGNKHIHVHHLFQLLTVIGRTFSCQACTIRKISSSHFSTFLASLKTYLFANTFVILSITLLAHGLQFHCWIPEKHNCFPKLMMSCNARYCWIYKGNASRSDLGYMPWEGHIWFMSF